MNCVPCDILNSILKFWLFEPHFLINFFYIKKTCSGYLTPNSLWFIRNIFDTRHNGVAKGGQGVVANDKRFGV